MEVVKIDGFDVSEANCNGILSSLYKRRDNISVKLDDAMLIGDDQLQDKLELEYDQVCGTISKLCEYRRNHDCLLEGDPGFRYC